MAFLSINEQDVLENTALNIVFREREIHQYQLNIDNYNFILSNLPQGDIPSDISQYIGSSTEDLPFFLSDTVFQQITDYQYRNRVRDLIRSEKTEQNKSKHLLEALKAQIPADQLETLVAAALAKINAPSA
jgi:hypothetical protein